MAGTVAAIGLAGGACFTVGLLWGKVNNGLSEAIKEVKEAVQGIWDKLDELPCLKPHCPSEKPKHGE